ncbi:MAG: penicillin-binding protein 2 [Verrucomicrobiaceae bacterium]|nr:MAG: penicillin-binding protein 2 [Verrucomicrobiaceae bacterium]
MSISHPVRPPEPGDRCLRIRAGLVCAGVVSIFLLLGWRLVHLQVREHARLQAEVELHRRTETLDASRGSILDARNRLLAVDEPVQKIIFDCNYLQSGEKLADAIEKSEGMESLKLRHAFTLEEIQQHYIAHMARLCAPAMGMTEQEFQEKVNTRRASRPNSQFPICRKISVADALRLRDALEEAGFGRYRENVGSQGSLIFRNSFDRAYPANVPLTHIVGAFGEPPRLKAGDQPRPPQGVAGVEKFFESDLHGTDGEREYEIDGWRNEIPAYRGHLTPPRNGKNLRLSIDLGLQSLLEAELDATGPQQGEVYLNELNAERVIVVLFDPATMGVRAIGCRDKVHGVEKPLLTNPVSEYLYEPGSTIKIVTLATALNTGRVNANTVIPIPNGGYYNGGDVSPIRDEHDDGSLSVTDVLVKSSNIGAFELARMQGSVRFEQKIREFGFCQKTGFESPVESRGWTAGNERGDRTGKMTLETLSRVAFGNAIVVTPAQMCGALGCIINDGTLRPLHLAESWVDDRGDPLEAMERPEPRQIISARAAEVVRQAMLQVVERGSGKPGRSQLFEIAGKTGTARKATTVIEKGRAKQKYIPGDVICSFIGFLPADKPRLAGLVIVDQPKSPRHSAYGGHIAAPLFRRIAEKAMAYYEVAPQFSPEVRKLPQAAANTPARAPLRPTSR